MNKKELVSFEKKIAGMFEDGLIKNPVHLSGGNEDQLIEIFEDIYKDDWIFSTWRNHYHWLLSGRSPEVLIEKIKKSSMHVYDDKFFTSAIVGGVAPIAVGVALAIKLARSDDHVWCFLGDMGASTGIAMESARFACGHDLPITFVVDDNGLSVRTNTRESWGCHKCEDMQQCSPGSGVVKSFNSTREWPHAGIGKKVMF